MYLSRSVTGRGLTVVRGRVQIRLKRCWDVLLLLVVLRGRTVYRDRWLHMGPAAWAMATTTHDLGRTGRTQRSRRRWRIAILLLLDLLMIRGTYWPRGRLIVLLLRVSLLGQNGPTTAERNSRGTNPSSWLMLLLLRILGLLMPTTQRGFWGAVRWNVGGGLDREGVVVFTGMMICDVIYFSGFFFFHFWWVRMSEKRFSFVRIFLASEEERRTKKLN